jgi:predicted transcriptional regulator
MRRVTVNFTDDAYNALEELARRRGSSMAEVLRDAIARERWFEEEVRSKKSRLLVEDDGKVRELVFAR